MVHAIGDNMSEETTVAVALTKVDGKLEQIQQSLAHQTELMGRNREDAIRDIAGCRADIVKLEARCDVLEKINEQTKATVRTVTLIAGALGTILGIGGTLIAKFI